jgi:hypothetical protein
VLHYYSAAKVVVKSDIKSPKKEQLAPSDRPKQAHFQLTQVVWNSSVRLTFLMKLIANLLGVLGLAWLAYFWLGVFWYPRFHFAMPNLNGVVQCTLLTAALCALAGKIVSRRWWAGIGLAMLTLVVIYARVH